jgi:hypothetical protein
MHFRGAVHDALATNHLGATDDMAVLGTHPDKPSSAPARGFPDSHRQKRERRADGPARPSSVPADDAKPRPALLRLQNRRLPLPREIREVLRVE